MLKKLQTMLRAIDSARGFNDEHDAGIAMSFRCKTRAACNSGMRGQSSSGALARPVACRTFASAEDRAAITDSGRARHARLLTRHSGVKNSRNSNAGDLIRDSRNAR